MRSDYQGNGRAFRDRSIGTMELPPVQALCSGMADSLSDELFIVSLSDIVRQILRSHF